MTKLTVTHLFQTLPQIRITELEARLRSDCQLAGDTQELQLQLAAHDGPLGGEAFTGTIPAEGTPAHRAALLGIVSRHGARITIEVTGSDNQGTTRRQALRLALRVSQALAKRHPPLALLWGPTRCLMQRTALDALPADKDPLALFVTVVEEVTGPRRLPSLMLDGAHIWIGQHLHARLGTLPRDVVQSAALAFLAASRQSPDLIQAQSFRHAGHTYRIAHAPEIGRIDLIPAAHSLSGLPTLPHADLDPTGPTAA